jgi:hypothetical protein
MSASTIVCVINDYYNSNLTENAIKSVNGYVDYIILITSNENKYSSLELSKKTTLIPMNSKHNSVGYRYLDGLNAINADYYFLLDYDDELTCPYIAFNKINFGMTDTDIAKYSEFYNAKKDIMSNVINNYVDWHISQYSLTKFFILNLNSIINQYKLDLDVSFDKILFAFGLLFGNICNYSFKDNYNIINPVFINSANSNSRMHTVKRKEFYKHTLTIFKELQDYKLESLNFDKIDMHKYYKQYINYQVDLNSFLAYPTKLHYKNLVKTYNIPIKKLVYYKYYMFVNGGKNE